MTARDIPHVSRPSRRLLPILLSALVCAAAASAALGVIARLDSLKSGLVAQYFATPNQTGAVIRTRPGVVPSTDEIATAWGGDTPPAFSATWTGAFVADVDGRYTFATRSDDGSHVYVDGQLVVDNGGAHSPTLKSADVQLTRGVHSIFIDFDQQGGGYLLELSWARDGGALRPATASSFVTRTASTTRVWGSVVLRRARSTAEWAMAVLLAAIGGLGVWRLALWVRSQLIAAQLWRAMRVVLAISAVLDIAGIWWGLPGNWMPAELAPLVVMNALAQHFSHGWFDTYPPLHFYVLTVFMSPALLLHALGRIDILDATIYNALLIWCRLVSTAGAAGMLVAAALCGARLFTPRAGVAAAAVLALVAPLLYYAKAANVDVPYVCWWALSMVVYLRLLDTPRLGDFILFALLATCAVCTKDQAYGLYLLMPLPILYRLWQENRRLGVARPAWRALVHPGILAAVVTVAVLFALIHNLAFNLSGFRDHVNYMVGPGSVNYRAFDQNWRGHLGVLGLTTHLVQEAFGWPLFAITLVGIAVSVTRPAWRRAAVWLLVPVVSYYFGFIDVILYCYDRFVLPMCFVAAIFAGLAIDRWLAAGLSRTWKIAAVAVVGLYSLLYVTTVDYLMIRDSRYTVERWLSARIGADDVVGFTFSLEYLPRLDRFRHADIASVEDLARERPSFYVLNADYGRAVPVDHPTKRLMDGLRDGSLGYRPALRYREPSPWPWLPGAHADLVGPREDTAVFVILRNVNPTLEVFERADRLHSRPQSPGKTP